MDGKKANLTPELKEIYDRVMNTSPTSAGVTAKTAGGALPTTPPAPSSNPLDAAIPNPPPAPVAPPQPVVASTQMPGMPAVPSAAEEALTSTPARPLSEGNTFAFNGGSHPAPAPNAKTDDKTKKKSKISLPIIIGLGVIFVAVWGVFWAIILGLIQR